MMRYQNMEKMLNSAIIALKKRCAQVIREKVIYFLRAAFRNFLQQFYNLRGTFS